jgi:hypothetical protein
VERQLDYLYFILFSRCLESGKTNVNLVSMVIWFYSWDILCIFFEIESGYVAQAGLELPCPPASDP